MIDAIYLLSILLISYCQLFIFIIILPLFIFIIISSFQIFFIFLILIFNSVSLTFDCTSYFVALLFYFLLFSLILLNITFFYR